MKQGNFLHGGADQLGAHRNILREHYAYACAITPDIEKRNRIVMARLLTGVLVAAGCEQQELILRVQLQILRPGSCPSPATIQRRLCEFREDPAFLSVEPRAHYDTEVWRRRRNLYFETHEKICALDSSHRRSINLHHRNYERLGQELDSDLIALCRDCHARFHDVLP